MNPNPYSPTASDSASGNQNDSTAALRSAGAGAFWSIALSFPITAALGLLFRFPVPFGTLDGGIAHVVPSLFALLFYGVLMGGFIVIGGAGAFAGLVVHLCASDAQSRIRYERWIAGLVSGILLLLLATLDWIIGPW